MLAEVDAALAEGVLTWSQVVHLCRVVPVATQEKWIELAKENSCRRLKGLVRRAVAGQRVGGEGEGGLPGPRYGLNVEMGLETHRWFEELREYLMRKEGRLITDEDVIEHLRGQVDVPVMEVESEREEGCEDQKTPTWLRKEVSARDHCCCQICGVQGDRAGLHVHHIVFRCLGGKTVRSNLLTVCGLHHGLIHSGLVQVTGSVGSGLVVTDGDGQSLSPMPQREDPSFAILRAPVEGVCTEDVRKTADVRRLTLEDVPEQVTWEWLQEHDDQVRWNRNGTMRFVE